MEERVGEKPSEADWCLFYVGVKALYTAIERTTFPVGVGPGTRNPETRARALVHSLR